MHRFPGRPSLSLLPILLVLSLSTAPGAWVWTSTDSVPTGGGPLAAGDVNGDGRPDLAVLDYTQSRVAILIGDGRGGFAQSALVDTGIRPRDLAVGDVNGDGFPDLVTVSEGPNPFTTAGTAGVLLGNGSGGFLPAPSHPVGRYPIALVLADLNGDGRLDVACANRFDDTVSILVGDGGGSFSAGGAFPCGWQPVAMCSADFNRDGRTDLAVAGSGDGSVTVLLGTESGMETLSPIGAVATAFGIAAGDVDGDGTPDAAVSDYGSGSAAVLLGRGDGTFLPGPPAAVGEFPGRLVLADLNRDGAADLIAVREFNGGRGENSVHFLPGRGDGTFGYPETLYGTANTGIYPLAPVLGDWNRDGKTDFAVSDPFLGRTASFRVDYLPGDLNADGRVDLADAVAALRLAAGILPGTEVFPGAGVRRDAPPGVPDAVAALQRLLGWSP